MTSKKQKVIRKPEPILQEAIQRLYIPVDDPREADEFLKTIDLYDILNKAIGHHTSYSINDAMVYLGFKRKKIHWQFYWLLKYNPQNIIHNEHKSSPLGNSIRKTLQNPGEGHGAAERKPQTFGHSG